MNRSTSRLCSLLMVLCLLVGVIPFSALATEATDSGVEFLYQQLTLGDDLTMNFEIALDEAVAAQAVVNLTVDGTVTPYTVNEMTANENGNYLFSVDVAAAQMTKDINVAVTVDGTAIAERTYTVRAYTDAILNGNYSKEAKDLVKEMLNYGAKAQAYFDYNVEALADAGLEAVTPAVMPTEAPEIAVEGNVAGISYYGSSMLFTGKLAVRYYFTAPNGVEGYTFTANGNSYEAKQKDSLYYVDVAGINPQDIDESVVLTVSKESSSLSISYGPMNYITRMWNGKGSESLNTLLQAMYGYHLAAEAYVEVGELESTYPAVLPNYELNREQNELEVFAFWMPPINEQQYAWMKEAGITAMMVDAKYGGLEHENIRDILTLANKYDIDIYLNVAFSQCSETWPANFEFYLDNPNFKGFYVDEPQTEEDINNIATMYKAADALGMRVIVNKMPWTDAEYDALFDAAFSGSNPETLVISSTNYPLMTDSVRDEWLEINGLTRQNAVNNNAEYWQFIATCGYGSDSGERRQVTEADIRWQSYAALAYGTTGICDFVYTTVIPGGEFNGDQHGPIWWTDVDDFSTYYRTDTYYALQNVNQEIAKFDHVLLSFDWQGVMVNAVGSNSYTTAALNNAPGKLAQHDRISNISNTKDLLVGCFEDANNYDGFLLVNFDETLGGNTDTNTVSVKFNKAYSAVAYVNGERQVVELTDGVFTCELLPGEAVFVIPVEGDVEVQPAELAIPADAVMVEDFADCEDYQGIAGVKALTDGTYTDVLSASYDYSLFSHVTFRMKASEGATVTVGGQALTIGNTDWNDVTIAISDLSGTDITVTGNIWIDQIFVQYIPTELPIPEDATLVTDFSTAASPWNNPNYGSGAKGTTAWYPEYDGVAGVQAFGMQENSEMQYTMWTAVLPDDFDYSAYTHITLRLKVDKNAARALYLGNTSTLKNFLSDVSANGEWTTVTLKIEDLSGYFVALANNASKSGEMVWIDQVYVSYIPDELAIPEGATLITNYGEAYTPWVNGNWGSHNLESQWYSVFEGRAGVLGVGSPSTGNAWNHFATASTKVSLTADAVNTLVIRYYATRQPLTFTVYANGYTVDVPVANFVVNEWAELTVDLTPILNQFTAEQVLQEVHIRLGSNAAGEFFYIDQLYLLNDVTEWTVSITDGTIDYEGESIPHGTTITLTHDSSVTPAGYVFAHWNVNGSAISDNTVVVTEDLVIEPIYALDVDELPIPEDATLVTDFSTAPTVTNNASYGSHNGFNTWYAEVDGVAGVLALGLEENSEYCYALWENVVPTDFDYSAYTHITFRMKVNKSALRTLWLAADNNNSSSLNVLGNISESNVWTTMTLKISDLPGFYVAIANASGYSGEMIWIDQIYVSYIPEELAIPDGAILINDYSADFTPWVNTNFGAYDLESQWYSVFQDRAGVLGVGSPSTGNAWNWFSTASTKVSVTESDANTLVIRYYATRQPLTFEVYAHGYTVSVAATEFKVNEWAELTVDLTSIFEQFTEDQVLQEVHIKLGSNAAGEFFYIDQLYLVNSPKELAIPDGAILINDYSASFTPWVNGNFGSHDLESQWYSEFQSRAGVLGVGSPSTGNAWNWFSTASTKVSVTESDANTLVIRYYATRQPLTFEVYAHGYTVSVAATNFKVNEWAELTVDLTSIFEQFATDQVLQEVHIKLGSNAAGEFFYIDQIYLMNIPKELAIPEGATLLSDYSASFTPWVKGDWGTHDLESQWYSEFQGRVGVLGVGSPSTGNAWNWFSTSATNVSVTSDDDNTLVIRYYATRQPLTFTVYAHGYTISVPVTNFVVNEWAELHVDMTTIFESLGGQALTSVHIQLGSNAAGEFFYIDQIYIQ